MVRPVVIFSGHVLLVSDARAELDFTPVESFYEVEGIRVPNVTFREGAKNVTYTPPPYWVLCGRGKRITLAPPNAIQAGASVQAVASKGPLAATPQNKI